MRALERKEFFSRDSAVLPAGTGKRKAIEALRGVVIGSEQEKRSPGIHVRDTILAAAYRGSHIVDGCVELKPEDIRYPRRRGGEKNLLIFIVDTSGSVAARDRLATVSATVVSFLQDAYYKRDKVCVLSVRADKPEIIVPPTQSASYAVRALDNTPIGGKTPLCAAFKRAEKLIAQQVRKEPDIVPMVITVTDGRATDGNAVEAARMLRKYPALVIDSERKGRISLGLARDIATAMGAAVVPIRDVDAQIMREKLSVL